MPTFNRPAWAHVEPRGGIPPAAAAAAVAAIAAAAFVTTYAVQITDALTAILAATAVTVSAGAAVVIRRLNRTGWGIIPRTAPRQIPAARQRVAQPTRAQLAARDTARRETLEWVLIRLARAGELPAASADDMAPVLRQAGGQS